MLHRGEAPPNHLYLPGCPTLDPSDNRYSFGTSQSTAPDHQTQPQQKGVTGLSTVDPAEDPVTLTIGAYVISATPIVQADRLQLVVRLAQRCAA